MNSEAHIMTCVVVDEMMMMMMRMNGGKKIDSLY